MRSSAWMIAYAVVLVLLGATYAALVFYPSVALTLALCALVAMVVALLLTLLR